MQMEFGKTIPALDGYYRSHEGLSLHGRLQPLLRYPVEVLALCRRFRFNGADIQGEGKALLLVRPPPTTAGLSHHEFYALWAEDIVRFVAARLRKEGTSFPGLRRYLRNKEVLEFMRATWDALLLAYQQERAWDLTRYGVSYPLNSLRLQGVNRFRAQLVSHPMEAARRLKQCAADCRLWYFGGPKPRGRLLVFREKRVAMLASYIGRALPPAPPDPAGLEGLKSRLTSEPPAEPAYWRPFLREYFSRWSPLRPPRELFTMPSANAAVGFPRSRGGHVAGVQHLVLLGYALRKTRSRMTHPVITDDDPDGSYLELLSDALHPSSQLRPGNDGLDKLFWGSWDDLEKSLPGTGVRLQSYLIEAVDYVMDNVDYLPILPISAEERGLKTRFPTCSLTAANLVQQILRRVIDHVMINDPRFSEALGGHSGIDLRGESGPWESQDCTAATDLHPEWLTRGVYEVLADQYPGTLDRYRKWFHKLFGPKRLLSCNAEEVGPFTRLPGSLEPVNPFSALYPRAPLLDDRYTPGVSEVPSGLGHAELILSIWNEWLQRLNGLPGVVTTTGQMMGDPTSFPPLMLVTLCSAEETLKVYPYTSKERRRRYRGLRRSDAKLKGVGDDACNPRWTRPRSSLYRAKIQELGGIISLPKTFWHPHRALIAEVALECGHEVSYWPSSILVAPPGGSKGHVTWQMQPSAFTDTDRPFRRVPKFFWKLSPYYYTWALARRLGLPLAAPVAYGGIGLPIWPKSSLLYHAQWLSFLSQASKSELVVGLGLSPTGNSQQSLLERTASDWLAQVFRAADDYTKQGMELLSPCALDDTAQRRISIGDAYRLSVGRLRSTEFYFRIPPEVVNLSAPSVRMSGDRFRRKIHQKRLVITRGYGATKRDVEMKTQLFFSTSGGFLPDPWAKPSSAYGIERSTEVKTRWKAPWLRGVG